MTTDPGHHPSPVPPPQGYAPPPPGYGPPPVVPPPPQGYGPSSVPAYGQQAPMPNPAPMPAPGPLGDPGPMDRAALHKTEDTRTYPCRACGAQLVFDPTSGQLRCRSCGTTADVSGPTAPIQLAKHDLREATRALRAATVPQTLERDVVCQACGGRTSFTGTLTATRCPYCATPIQRDDLREVTSRLPVDGMLPFRIDDRTARANIEKWINSRWFAPKEFKSYRELGSFESVYLAYFAFDAHATASYQGRRGDNYTERVKDGDEWKTETRTRWSVVSGTVRREFRDHVQWANNGFNEAHVAALEPWPLGEAVPYSPEYVAGHLGRTYDLDADQTFEQRVRGTFESLMDTTIRRDIGGDQQQISSKDVRFDAVAFAHVLLPAWLLTVTYAGKPYQVLMNGVTGEVQGERPWSKAKVALAIIIGVLTVAVIVALVTMLS